MCKVAAMENEIGLLFRVQSAWKFLDGENQHQKNHLRARGCFRSIFDFSDTEQIIRNIHGRTVTVIRKRVDGYRIGDFNMLWLPSFRTDIKTTVFTRLAFGIVMARCTRYDLMRVRAKLRVLRMCICCSEGNSGEFSPVHDLTLTICVALYRMWKNPSGSRIGPVANVVSCKIRYRGKHRIRPQRLFVWINKSCE